MMQNPVQANQLLANQIMHSQMQSNIPPDPSIEGQIKNRIVATLTGENKQLREDITESKKKEF